MNRPSSTLAESAKRGTQRASSRSSPKPWELAELFPQGEALLELVDKDAGKVQSVLTKLETAVKEADKLTDRMRAFLAEAEHHAPDKH